MSFHKMGKTGATRFWWRVFFWGGEAWGLLPKKFFFRHVMFVCEIFKGRKQAGRDVCIKGSEQILCDGEWSPAGFYKK